MDWLLSATSTPEKLPSAICLPWFTATRWRPSRPPIWCPSCAAGVSEAFWWPLPREFLPEPSTERIGRCKELPTCAFGRTSEGHPRVTWSWRAGDSVPPWERAIYAEGSLWAIFLLDGWWPRGHSSQLMWMGGTKTGLLLVGVAQAAVFSAGMTPPEDLGMGGWRGTPSCPFPFCGKKPLPPKVHFSARAFNLLFSPTDVMQQKGERGPCILSLVSSTILPIVFVMFPPEVCQSIFMRINRPVFLQGPIQIHHWYGRASHGETLHSRRAQSNHGATLLSRFSSVSGSAAARVQAKKLYDWKTVFHPVFLSWRSFVFLPALLEAQDPRPVCLAMMRCPLQFSHGRAQFGNLADSRTSLGILGADETHSWDAVDVFPIALFQDLRVEAKPAQTPLCLSALWAAGPTTLGVKMRGAWGLRSFHLFLSCGRDRTRGLCWAFWTNVIRANSSQGFLDHLFAAWPRKRSFIWRPHLSSHRPFSPCKVARVWMWLSLSTVSWVWRSHLPTKTAKLRHVPSYGGQSLDPLWRRALSVLPSWGVHVGLLTVRPLRSPLASQLSFGGQMWAPATTAFVRVIPSSVNWSTVGVFSFCQPQGFQGCGWVVGRRALWAIFQDYGITPSSPLWGTSFATTVGGTGKGFLLPFPH